MKPSRMAITWIMSSTDGCIVRTETTVTITGQFNWPDVCAGLPRGGR
jgi:hypothetical protein